MPATTQKPLSVRLDTRIEIQAEPNADTATIQSDTGEVDHEEDNWTKLATLWAEILPDTGGEVVIGDQSVGVQRWRVTVRRRDDLATSQRFKVVDGKLRGKFLYIESFAPVTRSEEMTVICRQGKRG